jgi:hypothetical protein
MLEPGKSSGGAARGAVRLAMARNWVNRRVETFSFLDAETVRCRMSIDLTLPAMSFVTAGEFVFVPLLALAKRDLRNLDVRGPDDRPLPVLTTEQNAEAVVRGIKEYLSPLLPAGTVLDANHEKKLREIVEARDGDGSAAAYLRSDAPMGFLLDRVSDELVRKEIERLLEELESAFLLLVPLEYQPDRRIVCKVSYDVARELRTVETKSDRRYTTALAVLASLGLLGRSEVLDCVAFGLCESYHAEVIPPKDAYVAETSLTVCRQSDGSSGGRLETTLSVVLHAYRQELLFPLAFSGLLISVVLALLPARVYAIDAQTVAALLLVPFALSAYYIRGQDNSYVTRMLRGARLLVLFPLAAAIYVLTLAGIGEIPPAKGAIVSAGVLRGMRVALLASAFPTCVLLVTLVAPWLGRRARPRIRAREDAGYGWAVRSVVVLVLVVALVGVIGGGVVASSAWLRAGAPSSPTAKVSCSGLSDQTCVPPSEPSCQCREGRCHADAGSRRGRRSHARREAASCARCGRADSRPWGFGLATRSALRKSPHAFARHCWRGRR